MKLFYSPGACSLSPHIALREAGADFQLEKVDLAGKKYSGGDYRQLNPKGSVPALQLDNGEVLTEGAVILQYIGDQFPNSGLVPKAGTWERYRTQEWLNYVASDIHKGFSVLFGAKRWVANSEGNAQLKHGAREALGARFNVLNDHFKKQPYLLGQKLSAPDCYLYVCMRWCGRMEIDLAKWPALSEFMKRMSERPSVKKALEVEGLS